MKSERGELRGLLFLMLLFGAYLAYLSFTLPIHIDEALTHRYFAEPGWKIAISTYPFPNNHVLFSFLASFFVKFPLDPIFSMRLISVFTALANFFLLYKLIRSKTSPLVSLAMSVLWGMSLGGLYYATHARGYGLQLTLLLLGISILENQKTTDTSTERNKKLALFVLTSALGIFTVPTFIIPFGSIMIWYFFLGQTSKTQERSTIIKEVLLISITTALLAGIFYLPLFWYSGIDMIMHNQWVEERKLLNLSWREIWSTVKDVCAYVGPVLLVLSILSIIQSSINRSWRNLAFLGIYLVVPMLFVIITGSLPFARSFAYLGAIATIFVANGTEKIAYTRSKVLRVSAAASVVGAIIISIGQVRGLIRSDTRLAVEIQKELTDQVKNGTLYCHKWNETAHLVDYYTWRNSKGPSVKFVYTEDEWHRLQSEGALLVTQTTNKESLHSACEQILKKGEVLVYRCN